MGPIVIKFPVEVEVLDADTRGVSAGQQNCGAVHGFNRRNLTRRNLQSNCTPYAWKLREKGEKVKNVMCL